MIFGKLNIAGQHLSMQIRFFANDSTYLKILILSNFQQVSYPCLLQNMKIQEVVLILSLIPIKQKIFL
ncbi:hypothetical protein C5472_03830 [Photorhabdus sp. RW14-46]|nr:hypothetical protein PluDJC_10330 [Photorhabdus laumondii subsp. laumondii]NHB60303.1 hypothetical protein [Photorhabdus sp. RW14-46]RAW68246.1 hypothetical protein CKY15_17480 [Photorhabdus sp. S7-51]RAW68967.1 hypothetical protein CKY14_18285 [Photorhabdus sp. S14-60]RAW74638.1 hypothetical protein CKY06_18320 [Photorhabdus sp. S15-56]RAW81061.1 hypothetical protein CKY12_20515 [Photorhabdus sp. S12-55]RAW81093.1 hypothetical protein CKY09_20160 [Photorhabdus sp. S5P8-50]